MLVSSQNTSSWMMFSDITMPSIEPWNSSR